MAILNLNNAKNRLLRPDLRAIAASNVKNGCFLLCTDGELDVARYDYALTGLFSCLDAFSERFKHHSYALLRFSLA